MGGDRPLGLKGQESRDLSSLLEGLGTAAGSGGALKGGTLRHIFAVLADLELSNRQYTAQNVRLKVRHVASLAPVLAWLVRHDVAWALHGTFSAWRWLACYEVRAQQKKEAEEAVAQANASMDSHVRHASLRAALGSSSATSKAAQTARLRGIVQTWRQFAVNGTRTLTLMYRTIDLAPGATRAQHRTFHAAFTSWRAEAYHTLVERKLARSLEEKRAFRAQLRESREESVALSRKLRIATSQGTTMQQRCEEARSTLLLAQGITGGDPEGPTQVSKTDMESPEFMVELSKLQRRHSDLLTELSEVWRSADEATESLEEASQAVEAWERRLKRGALTEEFASPTVAGGQTLLERERDHTVRTRDILKQELVKLQTREVRLRRAAEEAELELVAAEGGHRDDGALLLDELRKSQRSFDRALAAEREASRSAQDLLRKSEIQCERLQTELFAERERSGSAVSAATAETRLEILKEQERSAALTERLREAKTWIDYLRKQHGEVVTSDRELHGTTVELQQVRQAIGQLTEANEQFLGVLEANRTNEEPPVISAKFKTFPNSQMPNSGLSAQPLQGPRGRALHDVSTAYPRSPSREMVAAAAQPGQRSWSPEARRPLLAAVTPPPPQGPTFMVGSPTYVVPPGGREPSRPQPSGTVRSLPPTPQGSFVPPPRTGNNGPAAPKASPLLPYGQAPRQLPGQHLPLQKGPGIHGPGSHVIASAPQPGPGPLDVPAVD